MLVNILIIVIFILILAILVLIHEFGHFIAAKENGILVEEFGFGFPPRVWSKKIGETVYSINAIPLGGFVKMYGEEYNEISAGKGESRLARTRAFVSKKPWQKALVILAGVIMNVFLAVGIYYFLLSANNFVSEPLPLIVNTRFRFGSEQGRVVISQIIKNSPAQKAGLTTEDAVLRIKPFNQTDWINVTDASQLISIIRNQSNQLTLIEAENIKNGTHKIAAVTPIYDTKLKRSIIGANLVDAIILKYQKPQEKIFSGFLHSYNILAYNVKAIGFLFGTSVKEKNIGPVSEAASGPIGIFSIISDLVKTSGKKFFVNLLNILALLSLSLALINVLPFPALDGGRMVFVIYEWITKKQVNQTVEKYVNFAGFVILIMLAILVSVNDIIRLIR